MCKITKNSKIKDFNSPRNESLIVLDYWSKKTEETFHLFIPFNINLSEKSTTQDVTNVMNSMVKHIFYVTSHDWTSREVHRIGE